MADDSVPKWLKALRRMQEARESTQPAAPGQPVPEKKSPGVYQRKPAKLGRWETRPDWFCGAKNMAGLPCRMLAIYDNGRCKWHGGCATGPKTEAGKEQARINGRKGGRPRKDPKP